jgi:hypothetical protein
VNRRTARVNRTGLAIVGLLLLAAGIAALLRALNVAPGVLGPPDAPVTDQVTRDFAAEQGWFWPVLAIALVLVALLALWWLLAQAGRDSLRTMRLDGGPRGSSTMPAAAASGALEDDLGRSPYLRRVRASFSGGASRPHLDLVVTMDPAADPEAVRERVDVALDRQRRALEAPDLSTMVHLRAR